MSDDQLRGDPASDGAGGRSDSLAIPIALFAACLAGQLHLVFVKSFNWDEFLHYTMMMLIRDGQWVQQFQVFHLRLLTWTPDVVGNLIDQMHAARLVMWAMHLVGLAMIYGIARQFTDRGSALFAAFIYLTAGYVFTQAFSIRADPVVTAVLMTSLFLLASGTLSIVRAIAIGALIGLAAMMTVKAMFYAPCFAGLLWWKYRDGREGAALARNVAVLLVAAALSFALFYWLHALDEPAFIEPSRSPPSATTYARWFVFDLPFAMYIGREMILAPLFFLCLALAPRGWRNIGLTAPQKAAMIGFIAPLAVLLFYRNTFPYLFVFLLAPVAVALAPVLGMARQRYGNLFLSLLIAASAVMLWIKEPRDVIERQRALIDYVHREFPRVTGYLDYSGMIADRPRILRYLTSGNGMIFYHNQGEAVIARESDRGNLPFIIANQPVLQAALEGRPIPETFLPDDLAVMKDQYVQQWGVLWREGSKIAPGAQPREFTLRRAGTFVLDGEAVAIDGVRIERGAKVMLGKGRHVVTGATRAPTILWRGNKLPSPPPDIAVDEMFTLY